MQPGHALLVSRQGKVRMEQILQQRGDSACSFERIYFSRGSDRDIYRERKMLGELLVPQILKAVDDDIDTPYSPSYPTRLRWHTMACCQDLRSTATA